MFSLKGTVSQDVLLSGFFHDLFLVFRNSEQFLPFLTFLSSEKGSVSLLREENFCLNRSNGGIKRSVFSH